MLNFFENATKEDFMLVIPEGKDGSINHAFTVADGYIFDSTQEYPMKLLVESINFICGNCGCEKIFKTRSFSLNNISK